MTKEQKRSLINNVCLIRKALNKAMILHDEITIDFFEEAANMSGDAIKDKTPRYEAYHSLIGDMLNEIESNMPSNDWLERLETQDK